MGRWLIYLGLVLVASGLLFVYGEKFGIGHLPGDIDIKGERYIVHLPIVTCLVISAGLSIGMWLVRRFFG